MVTILNPKEYKEQPVPEVDKEYHVFDDGKISPSRHSITTVTAVIPFSDCFDLDLLEAWNNEKRECYWLYSDKTDYFVKTAYEDEDEPTYFVRTKDGGWFSLGFFGARLDIDDSLYNIMIERFGEETDS